MIDPQDFRPLDDYVLIRPLDSHEGKIGSIIIPETANPEDRPRKGEVIAVGPGKRILNWDPFSGAPQTSSLKRPRVPTDLEVGEIVLYGQWTGHEINFAGYGDKPFLIMKESDVLGVIE